MNAIMKSASAMLAAAVVAAPSLVAAAPLPLPPPPYGLVTYEERVPNADLIGGGLAMFGVAYGASVLVGATSDRPADQHLFIPLVGPWMNLASRGNCIYYGCGPGEVANRVMLVADGLFQAAGVLEIVGGYLFPQTRTVTRVARLRVSPTAGPGGVGITAWGAF